MNKKIFYAFMLVFSVFLLFHQPIIAKAEQTDMVVTAQPGDTSVELQSMLDYNKNGSYDLTVKIPAGTYILKSELHIYSNTTIIADPKAKIMKSHMKGSMIANDLTTDKGGYTTTENITIDGGIWDSSKIANQETGTESFRFIHAANVTVKNVTICNVPDNSHLITYAGIKNGIIDHCTLYGYIGTTPKEAIQLDIVHDNVVVPSMQAEYIKYDDLPCNGIKITNCEIYDYPRAIGSHTSIKGVFHKNITISKNNLHNLDEVAIKAYNYVNLIVSDNTIHDAAVGVLAYTYIGNQQYHYFSALKKTKKETLPTDYHIVIKNNNIYNISAIKSGKTSTWGHGIRTIGSEHRPMTGVTIEDNTIENTDGMGILMQRTPNTVVTNNTIKSTANSGIYLIKGSNYCEISKNNLTQVGSTAVSPSGGIGLSASTDTLISENALSSSAKDGIFLTDKSKTCTITGNTINNSKSNGIALYNQSNENSVQDNTIKSYNNSGIYTCKINSAVINSNNIYGKSGSSEDGIYITGNSTSNSNFTLENNYIDTSKRYGIYISNAPKCYVASNTIINTAKNAIYLDKGSDGSKIYYNIITYVDNSLERYDRINATNCKKVVRYDNIIYKV
ncbi:MAG: right-handed parallel beta-helix repeat-containing protein [Anaerocolumna sp.]